jgi:hypothetical protein
MTTGYTYTYYHGIAILPLVPGTRVLTMVAWLVPMVLWQYHGSTTMVLVHMYQNTRGSQCTCVPFKVVT